MIRKMLIPVIVGLLLNSDLFSVARAGQVITDEHRKWAQEALIREKTLEGVRAPGSIAVLYFMHKCDRPELDALRKGLSYMLISDLSKVEGLYVVERVKLQAIVEEIGLGALGLVAQESAPRVGRLLGAANVVGGRFYNCELDKIGIDPGVLGMPDEKISDLPDSSGVLQEIFRMEKEILFGILEYLNKVPKTEEERKKLLEPMTTNLNALLFFFRGFHESDQVNYPLAERYYRAALKFDPDLTPASDALDELRRLGLIDIEEGLAYTPSEFILPEIRVDSARDHNYVSKWKPAK